MELDAIEGLIALGLISTEQAAAAARIGGADVGRFGRLELVGVDAAALLPSVAALTGIPVAPPELLRATMAPALAPATQTGMSALPACPVVRAPGAPTEVLICDPQTRARVTELLGPMYKPWLAAEADVRRLAASLLTAATTSTAPAPAPAAAPAPTSASGEAKAHAPTVASNEMAAFVDAPRARSAGLSQAALAAALAEPVDLSEADKRRILELDAKLDATGPAELLGVAPHLSADEIKERYYQLSRAFHPDAHFRKKLGSFKPRVNRVFRALKKACDTLVAQAEARDHLDLEMADSATPAVVATASAPAAAPRPAALDLDGPVRREPQRQRTVSAVRPPAGPAHTNNRKPLMAALVGAAAVVLVIVVAVAMRGGADHPPAVPSDPALRQAKLVESAQAANARGDNAEAIAFATEAMGLVPDSNLSARARAVRGRALLANGDREGGFRDLEDAVRRLPAGDPGRAEAEAALARARP